MGPEEVRIVRAVMPLVAGWDTVTMSQVAEAAGIPEAALLAVFADKEAVLLACMAVLQADMAEALDPAEALRELAAVPVDRPLAARLTDALDILDAYYERVRARLDRLPTGEPARPFSRADSRIVGRFPEILEAFARLLEPHQAEFRLPAAALADALIGIQTRSTLSTEQLVDLFLHGAVR